MFGNPVYATMIDEGLKSVILPQSPNHLYEPIDYILSLSGKRIRPQLVLMGANLFGCEDLSKALPAAIAIEYFHNFSLIHDDIMDKAPLRRGKATVHEKWDDNVAILSGDALLVKAYEQLTNCDVRFLSDLIKTFNKVSIEVCEGQQYDMDFESRSDVTQDEYIQMIRLKTSVLLGGALEMGAILADTSLDQREYLYQFGVNLGIAFQLQDDILDAFGDPLTFGKQVGGDILVNKKTILHILLKNSLESEDLSNFSEILELNESESERKIEKMKELYNKYNVLNRSNELKEFYTDLSYKSLSKINVAETKKQDLFHLADSLMNRVK